MSVYDKVGNLTEVRAADAAHVIRKITTRLYERLFADGMTALEGRALVNYLASAVDFAAVITISKHQLNQMLGEGQIDPPDDSGGAESA